MIPEAAFVGTNLADWLTAGGQIAGAIGTFAAVVVALSIAVKDRQRAEADRRNEARGRAAMVLADMKADQRVEITNHGPQPIRAPRIVEVEIENAPGIVWVRRGERDPLVNVLAAGESITASGSLRRDDASGDPATGRLPADAAARIVIEFIDNEGHQWKRAGYAPPVLQRDDVRRRRIARLGRWSLHLEARRQS